MNFKENITLIKGFKLKEGHVFCRDYDFGSIDEIVGKTFTLDYEDEELKLCKKGFHACDSIGKVDTFYSVANPKNVFFKIFVEKAFFSDAEKYVFRSFTVKERYYVDKLTSGSRNTGDGNTGYGNTGDRNNGNRKNATRNTGDCNTGDWNSGTGNTGDRNTGDRNTGSRNTGDCNTGSRNLTNFSSGFFAIEEPKVFCFGKPTEYTRTQFVEEFNDIIIEEPCFDTLMQLPNADEETVKRYLEKYESLNSKKI